MLGKANAISRGSAPVAVLAMASVPFVPAYWQPARPGPAAGSHYVTDGKWPAGLAKWPANVTGHPRSPRVPRFARLLAVVDYLIVAVNARQASAVNVSTGPLRSAVSRTSTAPAEATSTHSPPLSPE